LNKSAIYPITGNLSQLMKDIVTCKTGNNSMLPKQSNIGFWILAIDNRQGNPLLIAVVWHYQCI